MKNIIKFIFYDLIVILSGLYLWYVAIAGILNKITIENKHIILAILCAAICIKDKKD